VRRKLYSDDVKSRFVGIARKYRFLSAMTSWDIAPVDIGGRYADKFELFCDRRYSAND